MKMKTSISTTLACLGLLSAANPVIAGANSAEGKTVLAVFAHPDDEITAAPLMAKLAREGANVQLAVVTDGRWGGASTPEEADALAATRAQEALCSTEALGIAPPILLGFEDGETPEDLYVIKGTLEAVVGQVSPDIMITWGPEGGYGHKDHRMVSSIITGIFQTGGEEGSAFPDAVYYPGLPEAQIQGFVPTSQFGATMQAIWGTTEENYLQYQIDVSDEDVEAAKTAAACHQSQWGEAALTDIGSMIDAGNNTIYLRKAVRKGRERSNLFHDHHGYWTGREHGPVVD